MRPEKPRIRVEIVLVVLGLAAFAALLFSGADGAQTIATSHHEARSSGQDPGPAPWNPQGAGPPPVAGSFDEAMDHDEPMDPNPDPAVEGQRELSGADPADLLPD